MRSRTQGGPCLAWGRRDCFQSARDNGWDPSQFWSRGGVVEKVLRARRRGEIHGTTGRPGSARLGIIHPSVQPHLLRQNPLSSPAHPPVGLGGGVSACALFPGLPEGARPRPAAELRWEGRRQQQRRADPSQRGELLPRPGPFSQPETPRSHRHKARRAPPRPGGEGPQAHPHHGPSGLPRIPTPSARGTPRLSRSSGGAAQPRKMLRPHGSGKSPCTAAPV